MSASLAIAAINQVEDYLNSIGHGYEVADSYRGAAGWLVFVASATILCSIITIIVRILYMESVIEKHRTIYEVTVSAHNYIQCYMYKILYYSILYIYIAIPAILWHCGVFNLMCMVDLDLGVILLFLCSQHLVVVVIIIITAYPITRYGTAAAHI